MLAGKTLIRSSELRAVSTEYQSFVSASQTFRDKYLALPGDITNATSLWGTDAGGCAGTNLTATTPGIPTCNGNGNGIIDTSGNGNEMFRFWQHLANAGLIAGSFTGVPDSGTYYLRIVSVTTPNIPKSRVGNGAWIVNNSSNVSISSTYFFDTYIAPTSFVIGATSQDPLLAKGPLTPEEAWNIDTKLDDGKPGTGNVSSLKNTTQASATSGCSDVNYSTAVTIGASSSYLLTNSATICSLAMKAGF